MDKNSKVIMTIKRGVFICTAFFFIACAGSNTESNGVEKKTIRFKNGALQLAGDLYLPQNFDIKKKYPAIVISHPASSVKEQTAGIYARKMAELGYVSLAFDASYYGESQGEPRGLEDPAQRVEDIRRAIDFFADQSYVDISRIGAVGICAGGGYSINTAQTDKRIKAVVGISTADIGDTFRKGWDGQASIDGALQILDKVAQQRILESRGEKPLYTSWAASKNVEDLTEEQQSSYDYYQTPRGYHPNYTGVFPFISFANIIAFSAFDNIDILLTQPILFIVGSKAGTRWQSEQAYARIHSPKELLIIEGANHFEMYDDEAYVNEAVDHIREFFTQYL
ncbi:MAG: alpha/beta hydrolase [Spirochaetia bacterium]